MTCAKITKLLEFLKETINAILWNEPSKINCDSLNHGHTRPLPSPITREKQISFFK